MRPVIRPGWPLLQPTHRTPLALSARPAGGRRPGMLSRLSVVQVPQLVTVASQLLTQQVERAAGPMRCSVVVVRFTTDDDQVLTLLSERSVSETVPASSVEGALSAFLELGPSSVLLVASCLVLWPQTSTTWGLS